MVLSDSRNQRSLMTLYFWNYKIALLGLRSEPVRSTSRARLAAFFFFFSPNQASTITISNAAAIASADGDIAVDRPGQPSFI